MLNDQLANALSTIKNAETKLPTYPLSFRRLSIPPMSFEEGLIMHVDIPFVSAFFIVDNAFANGSFNIAQSTPNNIY